MSTNLCGGCGDPAGHCALVCQCPTHVGSRAICEPCLSERDSDLAWILHYGVACIGDDPCDADLLRYYDAYVDLVVDFNARLPDDASLLVVDAPDTFVYSLVDILRNHYYCRFCQARAVQHRCAEYRLAAQSTA